ncbi:hypothetical protein DFQ01_10415 [Paenibacillus cellulosilyticus]|uniref:Uncharacterized protein n=1 Tax=Paenibacillus cellulosilyticus TaxID=375489 RepID=A0A2V2YVJ8_9BACL|nr:hypothetical protein [Paenibacillus cellulosilyticus]PWW05457.1 hypothetical protein DFQ01_10415 [Paenibacillus cellulosilyticus]QKS45503.1 hypothetical protein HUB94_14505 [Paenibacillus cellulosilyticus]
MNPKFTRTNYLVRKQVLSLIGAKFHIFDENEQVVMFSQMKAFKLKEDIRLYSDESMKEELITIQARSVIDFSATYDVVDAATGENLGSLRRKGMKSIIKDEWVILNPSEEEVGLIQEDSVLKALLRRFLTNLIPQKFTVSLRGTTVSEFKQNFNPFVSKLNVDFSLDTNNELDRRLGLAAAILMVAIEGKQG